MQPKKHKKQLQYLPSFFTFSINTSCTTEYIFTVLHVVYYRVDIYCITYSAVWSFLAVWFGRLVEQIWLSGFYLFGRPDLAVWIWISLYQEKTKKFFWSSIQEFLLCVIL